MQTPAFAAAKTAPTWKLFRGLIWVAAVMAACLCPTLAFGQTNSIWNGGAGNWSDLGNWNPAAVPNNSGTITYDVNIGVANSKVTMDVLIDTIDNLTLASKTSLTISAGDNLRLASGASLNSGTIKAVGSLTNQTGTNFTNAGTIINVSGGSIGNLGVLTNSGTLLNNQGSMLFNFNSLTNTGTILNAGFFDNEDENGSTAILNNIGTIINSGEMGNDGGSIYNSGTIRITSSGELFAEQLFNRGIFINDGEVFDPFGENFIGGHITNGGSFTMAFDEGFANLGMFTNTSSGTIAGPLGTNFANDGTLNNHGTIEATVTNTGGTINNYGVIINNSGNQFANYSGRIINAGTIINASDTTFLNFGTLKNDGSFTNNGTLVNGQTGFAFGTLSNSGTLDNKGTLTNFLNLLNSGTLNNTGTLSNNGTFTNTGTLKNNGAIDNTGTITNRGTLNDTASATFTNDGTITNFGKISGQISNGNFMGGSGTFTNNGTFTGRITSNGGTVVNNGTIIGGLTVLLFSSFTNNGTLIGGLDNHGDASNSGTIYIKAGDLLDNSPGANDGFFSNGGKIIDAGGISNGVVNEFDSSGTLIITATGQLSNAFVFNTNGLINNGTINNDASLTNEGTLTNGGTINNANDLRNANLFTGTLINTGTINEVLEGTDPFGSEVFADTLINRGTINDSGMVFGNTVFDNRGTLNITSAGVFNGPSSSGGSFLQSAGQTIVNGTLNSAATIQIQGGKLSGTGTINGNVVMGGTISPGNSPGILTINGNYTQTAFGTYVAEMAGLTAGTGYDQVDVNGAADLAGKLDVNLINGFTVALGDNFILMKYDSETGTFSMVDLPKLNKGLMWDLSYDPGFLDLSVTGTAATTAVATTPEPSTCLLWGTVGLLGIGIWARRKFRGELKSTT